MCGRSIRRLTGDERAARDEAESEHYQALYAEIEDQEREEYDREFGPTDNPAHQFKPNGARVHEKVLARIGQERNDQF